MADPVSDGANTALGSVALNVLTGGTQNVAVGRRALGSLTDGSKNVCVGWRAGDNYTGAETNNICIGQGTLGFAGESNSIRIGDNSASTALMSLTAARHWTASKSATADLRRHHRTAGVIRVQHFDRPVPPVSRHNNLCRWYPQHGTARWVPSGSNWPQPSARRCNRFLTPIQKGHCTDRQDQRRHPGS